MNAPQIIIALWLLLRIVVGYKLHNTFKEGKHNFFVNVLFAVIVTSLMIWDSYL